MNDRDYPTCRACGHPLCFMDRRDYDECPACGVDVPTWLRLDNDFRPTDPGVPAGMIPMASGLVPLQPIDSNDVRHSDWDRPVTMD